jgi:muramoyltetrapeptide carboxypeptidase
MREGKVKIAVVAPASRLEPETAERVQEIAQSAFRDRVELVFHPQCFLADGHFAGDDETRTNAFVDSANDESFAALWFARGGYGSGRIAEAVLSRLNAAARRKLYLGYSDGAFLLAGLYRHGFHAAHGPIPHDVRRVDGEEAVRRALSFLVDRAATALEPTIDGKQPTAAFNITILSHLIGTNLMPDLSGHVLMLEEVSEHLYAIDRSLVHIVSDETIRRVAGIRLGRCSDIPSNDPEFGESPEEIVQHWCKVSGIPHLGEADIGHDAQNKIVPFGLLEDMPG